MYLPATLAAVLLAVSATAKPLEHKVDTLHIASTPAGVGRTNKVLARSNGICSGWDMPPDFNNDLTVAITKMAQDCDERNITIKTKGGMTWSSGNTQVCLCNHGHADMDCKGVRKDYDTAMQAVDASCGSDQGGWLDFVGSRWDDVYTVGRDPLNDAGGSRIVECERM